MIIALITLHILSAFLLVLSILLQPGRSSGFSVTFSETATAIFGGKGATSFLEKFTAGAATVFVLSSLLLAIRMGHGGGGSVMKDVPASTTSEPAAPPSEPIGAPAETPGAPPAPAPVQGAQPDPMAPPPPPQP